MSETEPVVEPGPESVPEPVRPRNLVLCLDGTSNEPEKQWTNVVRLYSVLSRDADQLLYYDPGVGTMGARGAVTRAGQVWTKLMGLAFGHGIKDNIAEAYTWLMETYRPGDRIYVFGFSRGAFTARAVTGMLATVGLLRPSAGNLVPYALKVFAKAPRGEEGDPRRRAYWTTVDAFTRTFSRPAEEFPSRFDTAWRQVHFLGVWDTVRTVGWFNWHAKFVQAQWPFVQQVKNVAIARHAIAIDERRRYFPVHRFEISPSAQETAEQIRERLHEVWFAGIHGDVGAQDDDDHRLSDIAFDWMVREAVAAGLRIDARAYRKALGLTKERGGPELPALPADHAFGALHRNGRIWWWIGLGWVRRRIQPGDVVHESVLQRMAGSPAGPGPGPGPDGGGSPGAYRPRIPDGVGSVASLPPG